MPGYPQEAPMLTVKAYMTHPEYGEFHYLLIEDDCQSTDLEKAIDQARETSDASFSTEVEALHDGVRRAEEINGSPFAPEHRFELFYFDDEDSEVSTWISKEKLAAENSYNAEAVEPQARAVESQVMEKWIIAYKGLGGKLPPSSCAPLLELFGDFVGKAACGEPQDRAMLFEAEQRDTSYRSVAFDRWRDFLKRLGHSPSEATKLWKAVDSVTPIT